MLGNLKKWHVRFSEEIQQNTCHRGLVLSDHTCLLLGLVLKVVDQPFLVFFFHSFRLLIALVPTSNFYSVHSRYQV